MSGGWIAILLLQWAVILGLCGVVFALVRQVGVLHERVAPVGALATGHAPKVGERAPELEVHDWHGRTLQLGAPSPEGTDTLLFFLSPTCPVCKELLPTARRIAAEEKSALVLASDGPRAEHEAFVREHGLDRDAYVLSTPLGLAWSVARLPYAALLDAQGIVRAHGLVNTREHLESLFEARERGVGSLQEYAQRPPD